MQANNAIPYLQTPVPQQTEYRGTSDKSGKDDSFSKALGKELSQSKGTEKPANDKAPASEKSAAAQQKADAESPGEQAAAVAPLVIPSAYIEQPVLEELTIPGAQNVMEGIGEIGPTEEPAAVVQAVPEELMQTADMETISPLRQTAEVSKAASAAAAETLEEAAPRTEVRTDVASIKEDAASEAVKAAENTAVKPVAGEEKQQAQTEVKDTNIADLSKSIRQDMVSRQASFEAPAASPQQTVDMSDVKEGIQKLSQNMADQMAKGRVEFEIWLEPANLGKMAIKVAYESGRAIISIMCTNEKAMEMISQNARNLGNILEQHTGDNTVVVVEHPESDYLQQQADQENKGSYDQQGQQSKNQDDENDEAQSFLQQLRLGLAQ